MVLFYSELEISCGNDNPCKNGAICINGDNGSSSVCECTPGYSGSDCSSGMLLLVVSTKSLVVKLVVT